MRLSVVVIAGVGGLSSSVSAQEPATLRLGAPTAVYAEPFSRVGGVVEQNDGRVVVLDAIESRIVRIDFTRGTARAVGRQGRGPGEYTLPELLVQLSGDTTLAVEMGGGGQALVITRDGVSERRLRSARLPDETLFHRTDIQSDSQGRIYELVRAPAGAAQTSSQVSRLDRVTGERRGIAVISELLRSPLSKPAGSGGPDERPAARSGSSPPPFWSKDQWAAAPDGRVATVTVEPYRVTIYPAQGTPITGPELEYQRVRVTDAEREAWREEKRQLVPSLSYGPNGSVSASRVRPRFVEPDQWPEVLPPFGPKALRFAPDGILWIQRATAARAPALFDLVDRSARVTARVELPAATRLVGFGRGAVYVVRVDSDGLEFLERRPLPNAR